MTGAATASHRAVAVLAYHARTRHRLQRYAAGPETLDWDAQPAPFRHFEGAPRLTLPLAARAGDTPWQRLFEPGAIAPARPSLDSLGLLMELSFALAAWKQSGPDRWALRCTPSSGNLHPTEAYVLARGLQGVADGLYHYMPREHALERRAVLPVPAAPASAPSICIGLSSLHWREAWKYGERAFRYCQLDIGHAFGALRYAAAVLGWRIHDTAASHADTARLLGLDRAQDFAGAEVEEPEAQLAVDTGTGAVATGAAWEDLRDWRGRASRIDPRPMYRWPVIGEVAQASRCAPLATPAARPALTARALPAGSPRTAEALIRGRRSAQRFDRGARLGLERLWPLLDALQPRRSEGAPLPWDLWAAAPQVHLVLFAHRVDGLAPGAYLLPRSEAARPALQAALPHLAWQPVEGAPAGAPALFRLAANPALAGTLRTLSCHQAIAADAIFVAALLADLDAAVQVEPAAYRHLLREAGLIGQVLYLEAEALDLAGTGIGCYFDDAVHELLGLPTDAAAAGASASRWQVLYHFSVGAPVADTRIGTEPPYADRASPEPVTP